MKTSAGWTNAASRGASRDGYFPRGTSMLRRVQEERVVGLFFGQRALCIGALAPLNYVGTAEHTQAKLTPFKRLAHTGNAFEKIFFGSRAEADLVLKSVARMHERVNGSMPFDAGPVAQGTRYSAYDPELMLWTMAVMADSAQCFYELFIRRLDDSEREALWQDYVRFAELFGMPREVAPPSYPEFRRWWRGKLASEQMYLTDEARYVGYATAFEIPLPRRNQPGKRVHDAIMLGSLPARVRELYGLRYTPRDQAAFRAGVALIRSARRLTPGPFARGYNKRSFDLVARTERRRVARGEPTPQILEDGPAGPGIEVLERAA
ncbi:MAG TPA: oxygenase MpaB family protein [Solirubrobacteraceae bacterium]|nr:oxygenase MpaB family protein [Solirubrobacteraceae bacterium]